MRRTRPRHSDLPDDERKRANCRAYTHQLIKRGVLTPQACEDCGNPEVEAHHDDYTQPRQVRWKCAPCHREFHRRQTKQAAIEYPDGQSEFWAAVLPEFDAEYFHTVRIGNV